MATKKRRLSKKNRNTISGLLVGLASLYAVSTYMEVPQQQLNTFLLGTLLFFVGILILASLAILILKLLGKAKNKIVDELHEHQDADSQDIDRE